MTKRWAKYKGHVVRDVSYDGEQRLLGTKDKGLAIELGLTEERKPGEFMAWVPYDQIDCRWEEHFFATHQGHEFPITGERDDEYCLETPNIELGEKLGFRQYEKYLSDKWVKKSEVQVRKETTMFTWNGRFWEKV